MFLGYAGWGPGQLERELAQDAWTSIPAAPAMIFDAPPQAIWERAIRRRGIDL